MAELSLTDLQQFTRELLTVAQSIVRSPIRCSESDDFGVMTILFAVKQTIHFETIHMLLEANKQSDATVIARVMIEGMAILLWVSVDPEDRARKWRAYSLVSDLRLLRDNQRKGELVSAEQEQKLIERLKLEGGVFLKSGSVDAGDPNAYRSRWHIDQTGRSLTISAMVARAQDPNLLPLYDALSNWIHWNARGLGSGIQREGDQVKVRWDTDREGAWALAAGFQAMSLTIRTLDAHFDLGNADELKRIRDRYVEASLGRQAV
jgi:Family of unknown function (DUF5677)